MPVPMVMMKLVMNTSFVSSKRKSVIANILIQPTIKFTIYNLWQIFSAFIW